MDAETKNPPTQRILVVEDDVDIRMLFTAFLKIRGFEIVAVDSVREALSELLATEFDLVITDYQMPEMNGDVLIARLQWLPRVPRTILMSTYPAADQVARRCGADGFFRKGDPIQQILCLISEVLQ